MLVVHANWTAGALRLWAESLEAFVGTSTSASSANPSALGATDDRGEAAVATAPPVRAHPFALPAAEIIAGLEHAGRLGAPARWNGAATSHATMCLRLPATDGFPQPSDGLRGVVVTAERRGQSELAEFEVPALTLPSAYAISILLGLEDAGSTRAVEFGHALRYWMTIARFVLEMLADQRFVPTVIQSRGAGLAAAWQPWLHDEAARTRVGALLAGMPPVVRAVRDEHEGRPWSILDSALRTLTDATVRRVLIDDAFEDAVEGRDPADPHVAWLGGLLSEGVVVDPAAGDATEMLQEIGRWIASLHDDEGERPLRLGLTLCEPPDAALPGDLEPVPDDVRWRLGLHLQSAGDTPLTIEADRVWRDPAAAQVVSGGTRNLTEVLLAELDRAGRVCPLLARALSDAEPTGLDLTTVEACSFLREYKELLEESGFSVTAPDWWGETQMRLGARLVLDAPDLDDPAGAGLGIGAAGRSMLGLESLVGYRWEVAVGDTSLTPADVRRLARAGAQGSLVRLHGHWVEVDPERLADAADELESGSDGEMTLLGAIQLAHAPHAQRFGLPVVGLDASGWIADLLDASSGSARMPQLEQPGGFLGTLRPYQRVGLSWLAFLDGFGLGACLADDMGLGKTIQLIALLQAERELATDRGAIGATLLVVPTSVVSNWRRELGRFAPELDVHVHHGPDRPVGDRFLEIINTTDVVITTYTLIGRDRETVERIPWHRVVLDEAQYIKNPPTKQTATIRALRTTRRVALTGTPVENRLSELWSIMEFCNPGYLGHPAEFRRRFSVPIERHREAEPAERLRSLVRPFILRRLKTDPSVIDDLPPCVVTKEYATLSTEQAALYEGTVSDMLTQVSRAEGIQRRGLVLATLVRLKQICNHPAQVDASRKPGDGAGEGRRRRGRNEIAEGVAALLSRRSGKSERLMQMLEEVVATGDKALLFTQFRQMGHLLSAMIRHDLDCEVMFLHGGTPARQRQAMIDRFQDPRGGVPIFILSLRAGGIGVNLTAANHVFHYDRWWNPAVENQATDRAFRIGQTRTVHVHKFVCLGTLEERIDQMIEHKTELARNIVGAGEDWLTELSTGQLRELLTLRQSAMDGEEG